MSRSVRVKARVRYADTKKGTEDTNYLEQIAATSGSPLTIVQLEKTKWNEKQAAAVYKNTRED